MSALASAGSGTSAPPASTAISTRRLARLSALAGLLGVVMISVSYRINAGPPEANPTAAQLMAFAATNHTQIVTGAYLQAVGTVLIIAFSLALVLLAEAASRYAGWLTFFGGLILVTTGLIETTFYLFTASATQASTGFIGVELIHASQRLYFIVAAPAVFLPLGVVILASRASRPLPRVYGYLALLLGAVFVLVGIVGLYLPLQTVIDTLGEVQGVWWLLATVTLLIRPGAPPALPAATA